MSGPVLIFGARGQVGRELVALAGARRVPVVGLSRADANIADDYAVRAAIDMHKPAAVVNAAGYTAVDRAERDVEAATAANVTGPAILASACSDMGVPLVHLSSAYVFASPEIVLAAGRQVVISTAIHDAAPNRTEQVAQNAIDAALAWRSKHVEFSGTPLSEAIALFNRQNKIQLTLGNPAHGRLRVSGMFWLDDPEGFARLLEASFSIKAQRASALVISLQ
jgi:hypothetical protein